MRILFLSHYFPPEVNAPANRTFEHCRRWVRAGHEVHVVTCRPSHPRGVLFPGYGEAWSRGENCEGIQVHRVWTYIAPNRGVVRRTLNYMSFVPAAVLKGLTLGRFDVIVATSPQFFCAVAGWLVSGLRGTPWIFELRDLWPASIGAVGAVRASLALRTLERVELWLYRRSRAVVCVTRSFVENLVARGVPRAKLAFIPNGIEPSFWHGADPSAVRARYGIGRAEVVASYIGTVGLAHGVGIVLEAASSLRARLPALRILIVGDGAELDALKQEATDRGLENVLFTGLLPRTDIPGVMSASDMALVLLRPLDVFKAVIPSKMLEAFAGERAVILGVEGEAQRILEESGGGIAVPPGDARALGDVIVRLAEDADLRSRLGRAGRLYAEREFSREAWASRYLEILSAAASPECGTGPTAGPPT